MAREIDQLSYVKLEKSYGLDDITECLFGMLLGTAFGKFKPMVMFVTHEKPSSNEFDESGVVFFVEVDDENKDRDELDKLMSNFAKGANKILCESDEVTYMCGARIA